MNDNKLLAILRLQRSRAIGDILAKKLIASSGGVEYIFEQKKTILEKINGIGSHTIKHLFDKKIVLKQRKN
jgi:DNA processing protein